MYKVKVNSNNDKSQEKVTPCFVITKVLLDVSLNSIEEQRKEQRAQSENIFRVKSSVTNPETRLVEDSLLKMEIKQKSNHDWGSTVPTKVQM